MLIKIYINNFILKLSIKKSFVWSLTLIKHKRRYRTQMISFLSTTLSIITTLYFLIKKVVKYLKENPESTLKLLW